MYEIKLTIINLPEVFPFEQLGDVPHQLQLGQVVQFSEAAENAIFAQLFRDQPTEKGKSLLPTRSTADKTTSARIHSYYCTHARPSKQVEGYSGNCTW